MIYGQALVYVCTHGIELHGILPVSLEIHRVVLVWQQMVGEMLVDIVASTEQRPPAHIFRIVLESDIVSQGSAGLVRLVVAAEQYSSRNAYCGIKLDAVLHEYIKYTACEHSPQASSFKNKTYGRRRGWCGVIFLCHLLFFLLF